MRRVRARQNLTPVPRSTRSLSLCAYHTGPSPDSLRIIYFVQYGRSYSCYPSLGVECPLFAILPVKKRNVSKEWLKPPITIIKKKKKGTSPD